MLDRRNPVYKGSVYTLEAVNFDEFGNATQVMMTDGSMLSAGDKAKYRRIPGLGEVRTAQTAAVLGFLQREGVPVAFIHRRGPVSLCCQSARMIKVEYVIRRYVAGSAVGFYGLPEGQRFEQPVHELFYKGAVDLRGTYPELADTHDIKHGEGATPEGVFTDPRMVYQDGSWRLYPAKLPQADVEGGTEPLTSLTDGEMRDVISYGDCMRGLANRVFKLLEDRVARLGDFQLVDLKLEFGLLHGLPWLVVADVINQDNLRISRGGCMGFPALISKDLFRKVDFEPGMEGMILDHYKCGLDDVFAKL